MFLLNSSVQARVMLCLHITLKLSWCCENVTHLRNDWSPHFDSNNGISDSGASALGRSIASLAGLTLLDMS
jgi:hypothetical protein